MLDVTVSYNRYKFLGHEFLTWLWYLIENDHDLFRQVDSEIISFDVGNRIILENFRNDSPERITITGDSANLEEGRLALRKGAMVTEINISYLSGDHRWSFTIKGENLNISRLKTPETGPVETREDLEGVVLEKIYLIEKAVLLINTLYQNFIKIRINDGWYKKTVPLMKKWISR